MAKHRAIFFREPSIEPRIKQRIEGSFGGFWPKVEEKTGM
jgi:hypothetical protein